MRSQQALESFAAHLDKNQTRHERWLARKMKHWCERKDLLCHPQIAMHGYIVDFWFPQLNFAVELDGRWHDPQKDAQRDAHLLRNGVRVLRFPNPRNNLELNQIFYRVYAEATYQLRRARKPRPWKVLHKSTGFTKESNKYLTKENKNLALDEPCAKVENQWSLP